MSDILHDTERETLFDKIKDASPESVDKFWPLFEEKVAMYMPKVILEELVKDFSKKLKLPKKIPLETLADEDYAKNSSYLLKLEGLIDLYKQWYDKTGKDFEWDYVHEPKKEENKNNKPSFSSGFSIRKNNYDGNNSLIIFWGIINREASFGPTEGGLQKVELIVYSKDSQNQNRFVRLYVNEESREKNNEKVGHPSILYSGSGTTELNRHKIFLPNTKRMSFSPLALRFIAYLKDDAPDKIHPFEWIEKNCEKEESLCLNLDDIARHPEIEEDNYQVINEIMGRPELRHIKKKMHDTMRRISSVYIPTDVLEGMAKKHTPSFKPEQITNRNDALKNRTDGKLVDVNVEQLDEIIASSNINEVELKMYDGNNNIQLKEKYYLQNPKRENPNTKGYSVLQIKVKRPSSTSEHHKFETTLIVKNLDERANGSKKGNKHFIHNRFIFKVDEIMKHDDPDGRKHGYRGLYLLEYLLYGKKRRHDLKVMEAYNEDAYLLTDRIRSLLIKNNYQTAPGFMQIYNVLK